MELWEERESWLRASVRQAMPIGSKRSKVDLEKDTRERIATRREKLFAPNWDQATKTMRTTK